MAVNHQSFSTRLSVPFAQVCDLATKHAPYLRESMKRRAATIAALAHSAPETMAAQIIEAIRLAAKEGTPEELDKALRLAKTDIHLVCALSDIGGIWALEEVTTQLSAFADAAMQAALLGAAQELSANGQIPPLGESPQTGPLPGLFIIAMGKYGAGELNYSSDVDFTIFFDPAIAKDWLGKTPSRITSRLVRRLVQSMGAVTSDGYVFRTDMRLRPDPGSTNPVVSTPGALIYYESVGQNWERAALIKARICAGDHDAGKAFLSELSPFIWRRSLDFAAIEDIHAMKRQIHVSLAQSGFEAAGHNVKLGRGGIREIEFFTQTQQLILGGRDQTLRQAQTCAALDALAHAGHISPDTAAQLKQHYRMLRRAEHGAQMLNDQQTHTLPEDPQKRAAIAALIGYPSLADFDAQMQDIFKQVHTNYSALFPQSEPLSATGGSLVFTGVEDDPATLATLQEKGFKDPHVFLERMRVWHGGQIRATRSDRARTLLTRLGPELVRALANTGDPDHAFAVFTRFFENLNGGVQPLSLFCNRSTLLDLLVSLLNTAPRLAASFSNRVSILDAMLDPGFSTPLRDDPQAGAKRLIAAATQNPDYEALLNATRRTALEERLRIGVQVLTGKASTDEAAASYSALADAAINTLAQACEVQMRERFGPPPGAWVILGMGSLGARQMGEGSDLDIFTLYHTDEDTNAADPGRYFSRFTQRLISALSAQTPEGALYAIDMKLRPSGKAGPVAVSWPAYTAYYQEKAWTWEILALGRARVIAASSEGFGKSVTRHIAQILARKRDIKPMAHDVSTMIERLRNEFSQASLWDLKHARGGLIETDLLYQYVRLQDREAVIGKTLLTLQNAHALQLSLLHILRLCLPAPEITPPFPQPVKTLLAKRAGVQDFESLEAVLAKAQNEIAHLAEQILM
ncbi:MAG: bifunctional [glutamate--ammonia ligase]-adenylyl-L-tyrosine phosphorylase/[glutamate--ammonia-ligase] adenylyltransferase [Robiginitomaculum sp.]|nr:MAG: bifunctional [glutamate--ammonia ligase]-adenylyl-L-tyrosine phosphorylase/[glutamate--ammonia-ligase] adenylyltransferase [Robiginitomaculum sp.]